MTSPTLWMLMAQFNGQATVTLESICNQYFGMSSQKASVSAQKCTLPVPAFRLSSSQKSPWLVHLSDLALHIDKCRELASKENIHRAA
ncbi:MAG TPA: pyocin activator protein PrtN [Rheinheimera sp.]|nr:pyocin activator protein PrtN [Rheinheimera sp.]